MTKSWCNNIYPKQFQSLSGSPWIIPKQHNLKLVPDTLCTNATILIAQFQIPYKAELYITELWAGPASSQNTPRLLNQGQLFMTHTRLFVYKLQSIAYPTVCDRVPKPRLHFCLKRKAVVTHWGTKQLSLCAQVCTCQGKHSYINAAIENTHQRQYKHCQLWWKGNRDSARI